MADWQGMDLDEELTDDNEGSRIQSEFGTHSRQTPRVASPIVNCAVNILILGVRGRIASNNY